MGSTLPQITYAHKVKDEERKVGYSHVYRNPKCKNGIMTTTKLGFSTLKQVVENSLKNYPDHDCLGIPTVTGEGVELTYTYAYESYSKVILDAKNFGKGLLTLNLCPPIKEKILGKDETFRFISVYGPNIY